MSTSSAPRHPPASLAARYRAVLGHAWTHRKQLATPRLRDTEAAFLPAALSLQHTPVHPLPRRTAWMLMGLAGCAFAWACASSVDIVAVASGRIIVRDHTKIIQPLERSVVRRVLVRDGDHVLAGQALVELDASTASADKAGIVQQLKAAQGEGLRTAALLQALSREHGPPVLPAAGPGPEPWSPDEQLAAAAQLDAEWEGYTARLTRMAAEIRRRQAEVDTARNMVAKLDTTLPLSRQREDDVRMLAAQGFMASHAGQDRTRERIELERDLVTQRARLQEAQAALQESEDSRAAFQAETRHTLLERQSQARLRLQQAHLEHAKAARRETLGTLTAPVSGTVQQLAIHTAGGVVTEAQPLMVIVPDGAAEPHLVAEVLLENKDIGFVFSGQRAEVKLETFPFTRHGTVAATVQLVSADAVQDERRGAVFPARLVLDSHSVDVNGQPVRLAPGMNLQAEIMTGRRRVIEFLLSPLQRTAHESLRER
ncbi:MAG: HlyD family type I secretion periplasmic adaptor subunit [Rhodoferax sp.]|nr:HlyD family type I secretion periplasmic adaptor subunit [Rhodoferax sp.]